MISKQYGIKSRNSKQCTETSECESLKDGSSCAIPRGETKGRCIPTWFGICHGWAPYAFSEATPANPVVKNGVTFYPGDLEGIMSLVYGSNLPTKFLSERCNTNKPETNDDGRVGENACRDMNPGSFHVVATEHARTSVDRIRRRPHLRRPSLESTRPQLQGHQRHQRRQAPRDFSKTDAAALLGLDVKFAEVLSSTKLKKGETAKGVFKATEAGEVVVHSSGTGDAELYIKKGAEASKEANDCASTGSTADETCKIVLAAGDELHDTVEGFSDESSVKASIGTKLPTNDIKYTFNADAARFFHVKMDFRYISESSPARTSHITRIDEFTRTDSYEYILETDANGVILGGEVAQREPHASPRLRVVALGQAARQRRGWSHHVRRGRRAQQRSREGDGRRRRADARDQGAPPRQEAPRTFLGIRHGGRPRGQEAHAEAHGYRQRGSLRSSRSEAHRPSLRREVHGPDLGREHRAHGPRRRRQLHRPRPCTRRSPDGHPHRGNQVNVG